MRKLIQKIDYYCPLVPTYFYHIFNRTNNKELLFRSDDDRRLFLQKMGEYFSGYLEFFTYCLIPNHFHLLVRIKTPAELEETLFAAPFEKRLLVHHEVLAQPPEMRDWSAVVVGQFHRFFTSYAKAYNEKYGRDGNLLHRRFKRAIVKSNEHFETLIYYLHANSKKHKVMADFRNYPWNSYQAILSNSPTKLNRKMVLEWFGGTEAFVHFHQRMEEWKDIQHLIIED